MSKKKNLLLSSIMCSLILGVSAAPVSAETIETFNLDEMVKEYRLFQYHILLRS